MQTSSLVFHICFITSTSTERRYRCKFDQRLFASRVACQTPLWCFRATVYFISSNTLLSTLRKGCPTSQLVIYIANKIMCVVGRNLSYQLCERGCPTLSWEYILPTKLCVWLEATLCYLLCERVVQLPSWEYIFPTKLCVWLGAFLSLYRSPNIVQ